MKNNKRILVFTDYLLSGGVASFTINLVNELAKENDVTLLYVQDSDNRLSRISANVRCIRYSYPSNSTAMLYMLQKKWLMHAVRLKARSHTKPSPMPSLQRVTYAQAMKAILPKEVTHSIYDIAISTVEFFCNDAVALHVQAKKKIAWIHPDYSALNIDIYFDRIVLDQYDRIATVSEKTRQSLVKCIPDYASKAVFVPNLIDAETIRKLGAEKPAEYVNCEEKKRIVTVCRVDNSSKRLDRIIGIVKMLLSRGESFHWFVVGDGPDYSHMCELIRKNGLQSSITMLGNRGNPYPYMKYADLFVLTSQYEGKPIAVDEALTLGCPVVVTDYTSSAEQVNPEVGFVIHNNDATIAEDFCSVINWDTIREMRNILAREDYAERIKKDFYAKIEMILEE